MFSKLKSVIKTPEIEFLCAEEDFGVIPAPYSSRKYMPDWYKALPTRVTNENSFFLPTIKRCPPFLDAMCVGWIIPLAADVYFKSNHDGSKIDYKWTFHKSVIENHSDWQISCDESPNPDLPKPPLKFMNYWMIRVPPGYSVLFIQPINRQEKRFTCYSGLVDCDNYFEYINFPFFFNVPNFTGMIEAGTPLMQVIPIKRDGILKKGKINKFNDDDQEKVKKHRSRYSAYNSQYRNFFWVRK